MMQNYRITENTLAILPTDNAPNRTKIIEMEQDVYHTSSPSQIIRENCLHYGASYEGRKQSINYHLHYHQKVPIAIFPKRDLYAFPTESPRNKNCIWLLFHGVNDIQVEGNDASGMATVQFINGRRLVLNVSVYTMRAQYERAGVCRGVFEQL
ncbi:competence protein ComK [Gracilibacillus sp. S3-1-1]|uniref:Competence protein ComK n=1 Tax=Gracilibacillus pellucidus TaxID=3095368 RepID=A0ACC6M8F9_9BACI|nr:competence protein ComK [Gracilibacillus sp. S3-1-1]MDX8047132.1 competence protein ComK [Gracilibacillus sp. S3-1-1]